MTPWQVAVQLNSINGRIQILATERETSVTPYVEPHKPSVQESLSAGVVRIIGVNSTGQQFEFGVSQLALDEETLDVLIMIGPLL